MIIVKEAFLEQELALLICFKSKIWVLKEELLRDLFFNPVHTLLIGGHNLSQFFFLLRFSYFSNSI